LPSSAQYVVPLTQLTWHVPALQIFPAAHALDVPAVEHAPQLPLSVCRLWQTPSSAQYVVPVAHVALHVPALQILPAEHALSVVPAVEHPPQLLLSLTRS